MATVPASPHPTSPARVLLGVLALGCLVYSPTLAQGTGGVSFQGRSWHLVINVNGTKLTQWTSMSLPDTVVLTVTPQDSSGNALPLVGYEVQVWDQGVMRLVSSSVEAKRGVTTLVPLKQGQTTIQIRGSGLRQWILVEVGQGTLAVVPKQAPTPSTQRGGADLATPVAGGRVSYVRYEHTYHNQTTFKGRDGFVVEAYVGRDWGYGVVLVGGVGFGMLQADSLTVTVTARLLEAYFRVDYAFLNGKVIRPVASGGAGAYRIRTGGTGSGIWNTSLYWMLSAGADVAVSPKMTLELRATTQQLEEINSGHQNGHVGNLLVIGAGARFVF